MDLDIGRLLRHEVGRRRATQVLEVFLGGAILTHPKVEPFVV